MRRLLLIANVNAQTVTPRKVAVIERALASEFEVDLQRTKRAGHATHLARGADHEGVDLVVAMGGDGTVNEIANGLAGTGTPLGIIPGGGTNVLARSLGIPEDPIEATAHLLARRDAAPRRLPLGRADGRYFTFSCGIGLDGAIVRSVERRQRRKKAIGSGYFVWTALRVFLLQYDRRTPRVHLRWGEDLEHRRDGAFFAVVQKTNPYTYLGSREMRICPDAAIDLGLDLFAMDSMRTTRILRTVMRTFGRAGHTRGRHAISLHDESRIEVRCDRPLPVQMDGEYVGTRDHLLLESVPGALSLLA